MLKHGKAFRVPKDGLEESERNRYIGVINGPVTGATSGQESVSQYSKSEFLGHLEGEWWFQGCCCVRKHGRDLNCGETLLVAAIAAAGVQSTCPRALVHLKTP